KLGSEKSELLRYHDGAAMRSPWKWRIQRSVTPSAIAHGSQRLKASGGRRSRRSFSARSRNSRKPRTCAVCCTPNHVLCAITHPTRKKIGPRAGGLGGRQGSKKQSHSGP